VDSALIVVVCGFSINSGSMWIAIGNLLILNIFKLLRVLIGNLLIL